MSGDRVGGGMKRNRIVLTIVGLLAAPMAGAIVTVSGLMMIGQIITGNAPPTLEAWANAGSAAFLMGVYLGLFVGIPSAFLIGWPTHILLVRDQQSGRIVYIFLGALIAVIGTMLAAVVRSGPMALMYGLAFPQIALLILPAGAFGGLIFWLIRRPDRDSPKLDPEASAGGL